MRKFFLPVAFLFAAATAFAAGSNGPMSTIEQFTNALNKGDVKGAVATCASPSSVIDEFPPHVWQGASACTDWARAFVSFMKANGITAPHVTLGKATHVDVTGNDAYVVVPATFSYKAHRKVVTESGAMLTAVLNKNGAGWQIESWAWTEGH